MSSLQLGCGRGGIFPPSSFSAIILATGLLRLERSGLSFSCLVTIAFVSPLFLFASSTCAPTSVIKSAWHGYVKRLIALGRSPGSPWASEISLINFSPFRILPAVTELPHPSRISAYHSGLIHCRLRKRNLRLF